MYGDRVESTRVSSPKLIRRSSLTDGPVKLTMPERRRQANASSVRSCLPATITNCVLPPKIDCRAETSSPRRGCRSRPFSDDEAGRYACTVSRSNTFHGNQSQSSSPRLGTPQSFDPPISTDLSSGYYVPYQCVSSTKATTNWAPSEVVRSLTSTRVTLVRTPIND